MVTVMVEWEQIEAGWYTGPLGSIVRERTGWVLYPDNTTARLGPFGTKREAEEAARRPPATAEKERT